MCGTRGREKRAGESGAFRSEVKIDADENRLEKERERERERERDGGRTKWEGERFLGLIEGIKGWKDG